MLTRRVSSGGLKDFTQAQKSSMSVKVWVIFRRDPSTSKKEQSRTCSRLRKIMCAYFDALMLLYIFWSYCFPSAIPSKCLDCSHTLNRDSMWQWMSAWSMTHDPKSIQEVTMFSVHFQTWKLSFVAIIWFILRFRLAIWLYTSFIHNQRLWIIYY